PGLAVPALRDRTAGDDAARVVVRGGGTGLWGRLVVVALDGDAPVLADPAGAALVGVGRKLGAGVEPHGGPGRAHVVQAFEGGLGDQLVLGRGAGLGELGAGGGVALGRVGQGLLGRRVGAGEIH